MSQPFLIPSLDDQNFGFVGLPASGSAAVPVLLLTVSCSSNFVRRTVSDDRTVRDGL